MLHRMHRRPLHRPGALHVRGPDTRQEGGLMSDFQIILLIEVGVIAFCQLVTFMRR